MLPAVVGHERSQYRVPCRRAGPGGLSTPHLHLQESPADVMLGSDVCLVCVHTEKQAIDVLAGEDGLLAVGAKGMADKVLYVVQHTAAVDVVRICLHPLSEDAELCDCWDFYCNYCCLYRVVVNAVAVLSFKVGVYCR